MIRDRAFFYGTLIFFVTLILGAGAYYQFYFKRDYLSESKAKDKAQKFINENLLSQGMTAKVLDITTDQGLYKMKVKLNENQEVDTYMDKEGKIFFTNVLIMKDVEKENKAANGNTEKTTVEKKSDKPNVELFVMSYCPYGTQIEKGIIPVVETLGDKIDFKLKFVFYAMHGQRELNEELNQYCIGKKAGDDKFLSYLKCFLEKEEDGQASACMKSNNIDEKEIASCVKDTDKKYKVTEKFEKKKDWNGSYPPFDIYKDDNEKYGVQGSPTLVINKTKISIGRDSASLLKAICSAFNNPPEECNKELSAETPSSGFGQGTTSNTASGSCN